MTALRWVYTGEDQCNVTSPHVSQCCGEGMWFNEREAAFNGEISLICQGCGKCCEAVPSPVTDDEIIRADIAARVEAEARELAEAECVDCVDTGWRASGGQEVPCLCEAREPDYRDDFERAS